MFVHLGYIVFKSTSPATFFFFPPYFYFLLFFAATCFSWAVFIKALPLPGTARDLIAAAGGYLPKLNFISSQAPGALPAGYLYISG